MKGAQSVQSVPSSQKKKEEPLPPSSHSPSFARNKHESSQRSEEEWPTSPPNQWPRRLGSAV
eukprot:2510474-Prymnesium_polylepis.1